MFGKNGFLNIDHLQQQSATRLNKSTDNKKEAVTDKAHSCPKCNELLSKVSFGSTSVEKCLFCKGLWLKAGQLEHICDFFSDDQIDRLQCIGAVKEKKPSYQSLFHFNSKMSCPHCSNNLREIYFKLDSKIRLDICDGCQGVFYDADEF